MEQIFCLKRGDIENKIGGSLPQGSFNHLALNDLLEIEHFFIPRPQVEQDESYKQIIPYQVFVHEGHVFVYRRGGGVGENRLAGCLSIGIGGHINSEDGRDYVLTPETYHNALLRERQEELFCPDEVTADFAGWINDDSDTVGRVHLGAVHICEVERGKRVTIRRNGEDIHEQGWWSPEEIRAREREFEKWSLLALELIRRRSR